MPCTFSHQALTAEEGLAPPHLGVHFTASEEARYAPDCRKTVCPDSVHVDVTRQVGARTTPRRPAGSAVNVFRRTITAE